MRLPKSRLIAAAAVTGTACALAASGLALAGSPPAWSKHNPAVPGVHTNTTPALSQVDVSGLNGTFLAWKGEFDNAVQYKIRLRGHWYPEGAVPGAHTNTSPTAALYATIGGKEAVLVAWKTIGKGGLSSIDYSDGVVTTTSGKISWTKRATLPGGTLSETSASPAVLVPQNAVNPRVIVAYRGPGNHVRIEIGTQTSFGRTFSWGTKKVRSAWISGASWALTSEQPALAEIIKPTTQDGTIYVFWTQLIGKGPDKQIDYATTTDIKNVGLDGNASLTWSAGTPVPNISVKGGFAQTTGSPAVASASVFGYGPLLLAYKGPYGFNIRYQTLSDAGVWSDPNGYVTGSNSTTGLGPALEHGTLANVSRTSAQIFLHQYTG